LSCGANDVSMTSAASSIDVGGSVGGYRLERLLGSGETGVVYLAERAGKRVALKVVAPELARSARFRQRFLGDYELLAEIDHPAVLPVYAAGEADGVLYIASRYVEGADLDTVLRDGPLSPEQAVGVVEQVAGALHAAHCRGLVHRDVKPPNIFLEASTHQAYLADFGLVGRTTGFAAPERIDGGRLDGRADVHSLGCVLAASVADTWPELEDVLDKARATDPDDRYTTAVEFAEACRQALASRPVAVEPPAPPSSRGRRSLVVAGTAVALAAGAAIALVLSLGGGHARRAAIVATPPSPVAPKVGPEVAGTMSRVAQALAAAPAQAPPPPPPVVYDVVANTGGVGVRYRLTPNHWCGGALPQTDPCWRDVVPGTGAAEGQQLRVYCFAAGTSVHGDAWWARVHLSPAEYVPTTFLRSAARYSSIAPPTSLRC